MISNKYRWFYAIAGAVIFQMCYHASDISDVVLENAYHDAVEEMQPYLTPYTIPAPLDEWLGYDDTTYGPTYNVQLKRNPPLKEAFTVPCLPPGHDHDDCQDRGFSYTTTDASLDFQASPPMFDSTVQFFQTSGESGTHYAVRNSLIMDNSAAVTFLKAHQGYIMIEGYTEHDNVEQVYLLITHQPDFVCKPTQGTKEGEVEATGEVLSVTIVCKKPSSSDEGMESTFETPQ